jgi:hypothetical protein
VLQFERIEVAVLITVLLCAGAAYGESSGARAASARSYQTPRILTEEIAWRRFPAFARRPSAIVYSGDDSALLAGRGSGPSRPPARLSSWISWRSWTSTEARGSGADWHDNCVPDCATGTYYPYADALRAYRPRRLGGYLLFTRLTVTYAGARPPYPAYRNGFITFKLGYTAKTKTFGWTAPWE